MTKLATFEDAVHLVSGSVVLLDVDGTLVPDGEQVLTSSTKEAISLLKESNNVYLTSNGKNRERTLRLAQELEVNLPKHQPAGKPFKRALEGVDSSYGPLVVIGDKYLVDGLFALNIGGTFLPVARKQSGNERFSVRISFLIDRVVSWFL